MMRFHAVESERSLRDQIETAAIRNATFIVLLRHTAYKLHQAAIGHVRGVAWMVCPHEDCRRIAVLLGDRPAPPAAYVP